MDIAVVIILAIIICCVVSGLVSVSFIILNKPQKQKPPIISDELVNAFRTAEINSKKRPDYSNVYDAKMDTIIKTYSSGVSTEECKSLCNGNDFCQGFQMYPNNTACDLLSNVDTTYTFKESGWNFYTLKAKTQMKGFDEPMTNEEIAGSRIGTQIRNVRTKELCAPLCKSNVECVAFTLGSGGCSLHTSTEPRITSSGSTTYILKNINNSSS